jgi:hypothetical protein
MVGHCGRFLHEAYKRVYKESIHISWRHNEETQACDLDFVGGAAQPDAPKL